MRILFFLFLGIIYGNVYSQSYTKIDLSADKYTFYQLAGAKEKIKGIQHIEVFFVFKTDDFSDTLYIVGVYPDLKKRTELQIVLGYSGEDDMFNVAKMYDDPYYKNDTIFVTSQVPFKATTVTLRWVWNEKSKMFESIDPELEDHSWEKLTEADSLLADGDILGAIALYSEIEYPTSYMNEYEKGKEIMKVAHDYALKSFNSSDYEGAVVKMFSGLTFWTNEIYLGFSSAEELHVYLEDEYGAKWTLDEVKLWLGDYGLFLHKAGSFDGSIEKNSYLTKLFPETAGPYLQLADSYFESGNKTKAKETYKKYSDLMKKLKREKEIPKRVKERMK